MKSSYTVNKLDEIISMITFVKNPKKIVEFGILNGCSLNSFIKNSSVTCKIYAYDIFEKFNGNSADYEKTVKKYKDCENVIINRGNFFDIVDNFQNNSIDILHVDIANDGDIFKFCIDNYFNKIKEDGIIILEGGSKERDNVHWMKKYDKTPINPYIESLKNNYNIHTVNDFPSITLISKKV